MKTRFRRGFDVAAAHAHLLRADHRLAAWMRRIGPLPADPRWRRPFEVGDALARAILYQQLSGKAAATIVARVEAALGARRLDAAALARVDDATLRACGVSNNKLLALRDLARHADAGLLPDGRRMSRMDDEEIVDSLIAVRGIGRWTAQMLLMFRLGRPDLLPIDDLGVRKGVQRVDGGAAMPSPSALSERGEPWGPYRSYASFYLWRIADGAGE